MKTGFFSKQLTIDGQAFAFTCGGGQVRAAA